jgi:hypothetical protein
MVASVLARAYRSLAQDLKTRDMNDPAAWFSEIIAEISGNYVSWFVQLPTFGVGLQDLLFSGSAYVDSNRVFPHTDA